MTEPVATRRTIEVRPVTRIEGHGKIVVRLDEDGHVRDASLDVEEFRGFEKFCEGRMLWDLPAVTSRICGFCPTSHHVASVKACEALLGVEIPPAAAKLRELLTLGQIIQSHALHFYFCAMPDFFGKGLECADRSVFGLLETQKKLILQAIRLRKAGQDIVDIVGGGRLHPVSCLPGGLTKPLDYANRYRLLEAVTRAIPLARTAVATAKELYSKNRESFESFASFPSLYMGLTKDGRLTFYDGVVRVIDESGSPVTEFAAKDYLGHLQERVESRTWTKSVYLKTRGPGTGSYRVAALARVNLATEAGTQHANAELRELKQTSPGAPICGSLFYHWARMVELLYAVERANDLLRDPEILSSEVRVPVRPSGGEGVGIVEAPRGTLIHHYWADEGGRVTKVNLVVSTAHNKQAMDRSILAVARNVIEGGNVREGGLRELEMAVRCYDPCLSCSTHAFGQMPLELTVLDATGEVRGRHLHACGGER